MGLAWSEDSGVDTAIGRGQMVATMGPSGCGNTSLLNAVSGLDDISDREIFLEGDPLHPVPNRQRTRFGAEKTGRMQGLIGSDVEVYPARRVHMASQRPEIIHAPAFAVLDRDLRVVSVSPGFPCMQAGDQAPPNSALRSLLRLGLEGKRARAESLTLARSTWDVSVAPLFSEDGAQSLMVELSPSEERRDQEALTGGSDGKFHTIFDNASDAVFLLYDDRFVYCNSRAEELFGRRSGGLVCCNQAIGAPHQCEDGGHRARALEDLSAPRQSDGSQSHERVQERIRAAYEGTPQLFPWKCVRLDGTRFDAEVSLSRVEIDGRPLLLSIVRDITGAVTAYQSLERRVEERTRELTTLLQVSRNVVSTLEMRPLLDLALDQLRQVVAYRAACVMVEDGDSLIAVAWAGAAGAGQEAPKSIHPGDMPPKLVKRGQAIAEAGRDIVGDVQQADAPDIDDLVETGLVDPEKSGSWIGVPLLMKGRCIGVLSVDHPAAGGVELTVQDNGRGFDPGEAPSKSLGLSIMNERASGAGLSLDVDSSAGSGTRVTATWQPC